jgi:biotin carboxyl carrier protein
MKLTFGDQMLDLSPSGKGYIAAFGGRAFYVEVLRLEAGKLDFLIDGTRVVAYVSSAGAQRWVTVNGQTFVLAKSSGAKAVGPARDSASELAAPMPGQVRIVNVSAGEFVKKGQTLLVLEAMKMEIRIQAPKNGKVEVLRVKQGQTVEREQILIEITDEDE